VQLFYHKEITAKFLLPKEESRHLVRVLRKTEGEEVMFTDGLGSMYRCELISASEKKAELMILEIEEVLPRAAKLCVAVAPTKHADRLEWFAEKAVEIGIEKISPIICEHSERRRLKTDRLKRIAIAAMKQSLKSHLTVVDEPIDFKRFLEKVEAPIKLIAHLDKNNPGKDLRSMSVNKDTVVLIGPEGDFSPQELLWAKDAGFEEVTLGPSRLRTETAALVACAHLSFQIDILGNT